jgi:hypothetical protein
MPTKFYFTAGITLRSLCESFCIICCGHNFFVHVAAASDALRLQQEAITTLSTKTKLFRCWRF